MTHSSISDFKKVEGMVKQCLRLLRKKEYELNITTKDVREVTKHLSVIDHPKRHSCASGRSIVINVGAWWRRFGHHPEYKSFESDPVIGSLQGVDPEHALFAVVAHEVAHYVQFRFAPDAPRAEARFADWGKPHGNTFKVIYRHLRKDLVNPVLAK